jgi:hypothetical protein
MNIRFVTISERLNTAQNPNLRYIDSLDQQGNVGMSNIQFDLTDNFFAIRLLHTKLHVLDTLKMKLVL